MPFTMRGEIMVDVQTIISSLIKLLASTLTTRVRVATKGALNQRSTVNIHPKPPTTDHNNLLEPITQQIQPNIDDIIDMYVDVEKVPFKRKVSPTQKTNEDPSLVSPTRSLRVKTKTNGTISMITLKKTPKKEKNV